MNKSVFRRFGSNYFHAPSPYFSHGNRFSLRKIKVLIFLLMTFGGFFYVQNPIFAQRTREIVVEDFDNQLSEEELNNFAELTRRKVKELEANIKTIGDGKTPEDEFKNCLTAAKKLFHKGAIIQVSSKNRKTLTEYEPDAYFRALRALTSGNPPKYAKVEINFYNVAYISSYQKGTDGNYYATAVIFQEFRGYNKEGKLVYTDKTTKQINLVLSQTKNPIDGTKMWTVLLDDIKVQETM